jgi:hypothetical protein
MDHYFTATQFLLGAFALVLIIIFAVAAFLDSRFAKSSPDRDCRSERDFSFIPQSTGPDEGSESVFQESAPDLNA